MKKVCSYTLKFKLTAIDFTELPGNKASAKKFNVDVRGIREWRKSKEVIAQELIKNWKESGKDYQEVVASQRRLV